jgi:hypothetical protein
MFHQNADFVQVIYCDEMYILIDEQMEGQDLYMAFMFCFTSYTRGNGLLILFRRIKINFWNVATENVDIMMEVGSIWYLAQ